VSVSSFPEFENILTRTSGGADGQGGLRATFKDGMPVLPSRTLGSSLRDATKRGLDIALSAAALLVFLPLLVCLAIGVKLSSPGPVLFKQKRYGKDGRAFTIYKFRTMRTEAEDPTGVRQVRANDPGLTRLGAVMRAKSLDELPQLINVLKGDMSLIGPRPHAIGMKAAGLPYEELVPYYRLRHTVRPGLSGWAQVNGFRGPTTDAETARQRIEHDIAYIQNQSTWLDIKIIALTLRHEFLTGTGV
jgi:lipopolysaccharide/colanic/teichoic acid biosynthesis glycosyltransferase